MSYYATAVVGRFSSEYLQTELRDMAAAMAYLAAPRECVRCHRPASSATRDGASGWRPLCVHCSPAASSPSNRTAARAIEAAEAEIRQDDAGGRLIGLAVPFWEPTTLRNGTVERIARGAFVRSLRGRSAYACLDHDRATTFAQTRDGSLQLVEELAGLRFEIDARTTSGRRLGLLTRAAQRGFRGVSIGFNALADTRDTQNQRLVNDADLIEISLVTSGSPQYRGTWVTLNDDDGRARLSRANRAALEREIAMMS